ncbi:MAG: acyl-CoA dehydrogenase, partial [Calditrichota bacterium]
SRINLIFEGSSEIMRLFIAREAVDKHLEVAGDLIDPKKSLGDKLSEFPKIARFYAKWYPSQWIGWSRWPQHQEFGKLAGHLGFVERHARQLARNIFHGMVTYGGKLQHKEAFLFRAVDIGAELFAMAASISRATKLAKEGQKDAIKVADLYCRNARRKIEQLNHQLWANDDDRKYRFARQLLEDKYTWLEKGGVGLHLDADKTMSPQSATELI